MARSTLDELRWLLDFAAVDLEPLRLAELNRWRDRAWQFAMLWSPVGRPARRVMPLSRHSWAWMAVSGIVEGITAERVRDALTLLQAGLRAALSRLRAGRNWSPPSVPVSLVVERGRMRRVLTSPDGTPGPILLAAAADVLLAHWEQVRTCEAAGCDRLFVPADRRQKYCSAECGQRVRWQRFAPKRQRDYAAEYAHRVRKRLGASRVRVGRKKRRQLFGS